MATISGLCALQDPVAERLDADAELPRHAADHTEAVAVVLVDRFVDHPHGPLTQLLRVPLL